MVSSNLIKEKRKEKGLKLVDMAQLMQMSLRHYIRLENNEIKLYRISNILNLAKLLNLDMQELLNFLVSKESEAN